VGKVLAHLARRAPGWPANAGIPCRSRR
jgi:hypothetical protein